MSAAEREAVDTGEMRRGAGGGTEARFSREVDVSGRGLSEGQTAYFRASQLWEEDGRLLVVYHSINADRSMTVFKTGNEIIGMQLENISWTKPMLRSYTAKYTYGDLNMHEHD